MLLLVTPMAAVSAFKTRRPTAMSKQESVTVMLAAISMETAVVTSVTFNASIVSIASFVTHYG